MRVYCAEDARALARGASLPAPAMSNGDARPLQLQLPPEILDFTKQVLEERQRYLGPRPRRKRSHYSRKTART